jgi:hypothetical protein
LQNFINQTESILRQPNNALLLHCSWVAEIGRSFAFTDLADVEGDDERDSFEKIGEGARHKE